MYIVLWTNLPWKRKEKKERKKVFYTVLRIHGVLCTLLSFFFLLFFSKMGSACEMNFENRYVHVQ